MNKEEQKLEQEEVEEQEKEETTQLVRKSRNGDDSKVFAISAVDGEVSEGVSESNGHAVQSVISAVDVEVSNGVSESNGHAIHSEIAENEETITPPAEEQKIEESDWVLENGAKNAEPITPAAEEEQKIEQGDMVLENGVLITPAAEEEQKLEESERVLENESEAINGEQNSDNLVFYEKIKGVKSASTYIGEEQFLKYPGHIKFDVSSLDFIVQNNHTSKVNDRYEEVIEESDISSTNLHPSDSSSQEGGTSYEPSKEIESAEIDLINEDDLEITELDVERVIQKQTTHDLFCPNCKSCITKRVILRKRKRRIRIPDEEVKRSKPGTVTGPKLGTVSAQSPEDQVHEEGEVGDNDAQLDEDERGRGPFIFRCLSCFSIFIPTGDGFNWLTKIFTPNKRETALEQGTSSQMNVQQVTLAIPSSDSAHQSGQPSFLQDTNSPARVSGGLEVTTGKNTTHKGGDKTLTFQPPVNGKVVNGIASKLDMKAMEAVDSPAEQFDMYTMDQLTESKSGQEVQINRDGDLVATLPVKTHVTNVESAEDGILFPQQDGLKFLIAPIKGSPTLENLEEVPKPNLTVQPRDKEIIQLSPPSVSVVQASDVDGTLNISVSIPHEEQDVTATIVTKSALENKTVDSRSSDYGEVYPADMSQQLITETKIEVHSNEPIRTEISSALLDASVSKGKDTVITIDSQLPVSSHIVEGMMIPPTPAATVSLSEPQISTAGSGRSEVRDERKIEVIKSIVYGGLAESITSLSVVSSAAGGGAATLNVLALGAANLIGGLFVISHNLWDLRCDRDEQVSNQITEQKDRYKEVLGRRQNFMLHAVVAIISYLVFGLVAPVVYGFSFRGSDDKQLKLVVAAAASIVCIFVLAIAKAYVQRPPKPYLKTVTTFIILGFMVSGVSYAAGELVERLLEKLGLFQPTSAAPNLLLQEMTPLASGWASY
ncbi:hypothetical protein C2S51_022644 [Perilla frutescens var. frutescens]|nr:hypothetical protein C2S51_022644 [Perilla frutescens var. frutescens]